MKRWIRGAWRAVWWTWSILLTVGLILAITVFAWLEWKSRRGLDPDSVALMPAPTLVREAIVDPFASVGAQDVAEGVNVFFATDRAPAGPDDKVRFYRNERGDRLHWGRARITIGSEIDSWDELKAISVAKERTQSYIMRVASIEAFGALPDSASPLIAKQTESPTTDRSEELVEQINDHLRRSTRKDIVIYVHGYKVVFENPLLVATEFWHYMGYQGVMFAYAWPATPDVLAYGADLETTNYSARSLRKLIQFLAKETEVDRIHILGYSAGTRLVLSALDDLALMHSADDREAVQATYRVGDVILVCSDVDRGIFGNQLADGIWKVPRQLTVYVSEVDETLGMSQWVFRRRRLGRLFADDAFSEQLQEFLRRHPYLEFVDVSNAEDVTANNGHAYFHKSPWVSSDVLLTLATGRPAAERGLVAESTSPLWRFPDDYVERLRRLAAN